MNDSLDIASLFDPEFVADSLSDQVLDLLTRTEVIAAIVLFLSFFGLLCYYFIVVSQRVAIYGSNKAQLSFLKGIKMLQHKYYPTPFITSGHLQSVFGFTKRPIHRRTYEREILKLSDGGELALDFTNCDESDTVVIILPGIVSSSQAPYIRTLVAACEDAGVTSVVMNMRGIGGLQLKNTKTFCATDTADVSEVIHYLQDKFPHRRKMLLGTSFGGILSCQYIIQRPEEAKKFLECAVVICPLWNSLGAADRSERQITKQLVTNSIVKGACLYVQKHGDVLKKDCCVEKVVGYSKSMRNFDQLFTAPLNGYNSAEHYYEDASLVNKMHQVCIPVFGFCAGDDPLQPFELFPLDEAEEDGSNLVLLVTARGGHLGFLEGLFPSKRRLHYVDRFVKGFLLQFQRDWSLQSVGKCNSKGQELCKGIL